MKPIINCHTHIFKGDHVPSYLAKTFLPWPLYYLISLSLLVSVFRWWYNGPNNFFYSSTYRKFTEAVYRIKIIIIRSRMLSVLSFLIGVFLGLHTFFIVYDFCSSLSPADDATHSSIIDIKNWLETRNLLYLPSSSGTKLLLVFLFTVFFKSGRNILFFILKKIYSFLGILPGPKTKELAKRYINIGRFSFHRKQSTIFDRLQNQYPKGTGFIVLPMDMEYMAAGKLKKEATYHKQMEELAKIKQSPDNKNSIYPFVFAEPRRFVDEPDHFSYHTDGNGTITLNNCFIKTYIESYGFSGFKIYPALGYYPFDEKLLPLWKYAADNGIPILTHCIRGTIFYRGMKKREWDYHPVFEQPNNGKYEPMFLGEIKNSEFINNFTHPLNYLCLLDESLLRKLVAKSPNLHILFGFTNAEKPLKYTLKKLKLCFGHFGGDDEWKRYFESDRDNYGSQLSKNPNWGIEFFNGVDGNPAKGKLEQIWKYADWYSIICSMMLQYENIYADLSYIIHSDDIQPLLKSTLQNKKLSERVLFGTDFYVVRNHKSEKNMLADMFNNLSETEQDLIARDNPRNFLHNNIHGAIPI